MVEIRTQIWLEGSERPVSDGGGIRGRTGVAIVVTSCVVMHVVVVFSKRQIPLPTRAVHKTLVNNLAKLHAHRKRRMKSDMGK